MQSNLKLDSKFIYQYERVDRRQSRDVKDIAAAV